MLQRKWLEETILELKAEETEIRENSRTKLNVKNLQHELEKRGFILAVESESIENEKRRNAVRINLFLARPLEEPEP
jgi:hypothetical protein